MGYYRYEALDKETGKRISGEIESVSEEKVIDALIAKGLFLYEIKNQTKEKKIKRGVSNEKEIIFFTRQLSNLINAGIPLGEALKILNTLIKKGKLKRVVAILYEDMTGGIIFSDALIKHKEFFSDGYINMVKAGEEGGFLEATLQRILQNLEENYTMKIFIKGSMIYPIILLNVSIAAIVLMLTFILPKFIKIYNNFGKELPLLTRVIIKISTLLTTAWPFIIIGFFGSIGILTYFYKQKNGREFFDYNILRIPLFKDIITVSATGKFARAVGNMLKSGVGLLRALEIAKHLYNNVILKKEIEVIIEKVRRGKSLSNAIQESQYFPELVFFMTATGEKTGKLSDMLNEIATAYENETRQKIEFFIKIFEPALIIVMGIIVGIIITAMMLPVFGINNIGI